MWRGRAGVTSASNAAVGAAAVSARTIADKTPSLHIPSSRQVGVARAGSSANFIKGVDQY
jgi:hypothetical protein